MPIKLLNNTLYQLKKLFSKIKRPPIYTSVSFKISPIYQIIFWNFFPANLKKSFRPPKKRRYMTVTIINIFCNASLQKIKTVILGLRLYQCFVILAFQTIYGHTVYGRRITKSRLIFELLISVYRGIIWDIAYMYSHYICNSFGLNIVYIPKTPSVQFSGKILQKIRVYFEVY